MRPSETTISLSDAVRRASGVRDADNRTFVCRYTRDGIFTFKIDPAVLLEVKLINARHRFTANRDAVMLRVTLLDDYIDVWFNVNQLDDLWEVVGEVQ